MRFPRYRPRTRCATAGQRGAVRGAVQPPGPRGKVARQFLVRSILRGSRVVTRPMVIPGCVLARIEGSPHGMKSIELTHPAAQCYRELSDTPVGAEHSLSAAHRCCDDFEQ